MKSARVSILACGLLIAAAPLHAAPVLSLNPLNGELTGNPGQVVGWGFTISNNTDFLLITSADYLTTTGIGVFSDFVSVQFFVVGPAPEESIWTEDFNLGATTGIGSYTISPTAPVGALSTGTIELTYDLYSLSPNDPNFDPSKDTLSTGTVLSAPASVAASTPEPGTISLVGLGLLLAWTRRRVLTT
jgi:hypothetical protein